MAGTSKRRDGRDRGAPTGERKEGDRNDHKSGTKKEDVRARDRSTDRRRPKVSRRPRESGEDRHRRRTHSNDSDG